MVRVFGSDLWSVGVGGGFPTAGIGETLMKRRLAVWSIAGKKKIGTRPMVSHFPCTSKPAPTHPRTHTHTNTHRIPHVRTCVRALNIYFFVPTHTHTQTHLYIDPNRVSVSTIRPSVFHVPRGRTPRDRLRRSRRSPMTSASETEK